MQVNDMHLDNTMLGRIGGVLDNDIKWYRYIQNPITAIPRAAYPLIRDKLEMDRTAKEVAQYNKALPQDQRLDPTKNDTYFHQHAMYSAAQNGVFSALLAALAGELKEKYWDKPQKLKDGKTEAEINADSKKDLQNNYLAIKMALESNKPVDEVIIPNPTVQKIREMRNAKK